MPTDSALRLLLWIVALNAGLLGVLLWFRGLAGRTVFVGLLAADAVLAVVLLAAHRQDHPLAFVAIGAFLFLVVVPIPLRVGTAWAARRGRFDWAIRLAGLREMLQPGAGVGREREVLRFLQRVHSGDTREVLDMLRARAADAAAAGDAEQIAFVQEQIMTLLVIERRYEEAEAHAREHVTPEMVARRPRLATALIRTFGERGDIAEVVRTLSLLMGGGPSEDPDAAEVTAHCQVMTLAFLGRPDALEALFADEALAARTEPKVRAFWMAVAHQYAGDPEAARRAYDAAESLLGPGDEPARESIQERRAALTRPVAVREPADPEQAARLVEAILGQGAPAPAQAAVQPGPMRSTPVTLGLVLINLVAFGWVWFGGADDGVNRRLILAGASLRAAVAQGEWWRLVTASFLHAGWFHLGLNTLMLWFLGRFSERILGSVRLLILYVLGGAVGNLASHLFRSYPVSVGASSSLFALLGATFVAVWLSRGRVPEAWRRQMLLLLALATGLSFLPGAVDIRQIDNYAHLGGLVGGLGLGGLLLLSPGRPVVRWLGPLAGLVAVAALLYGAVGVVTSDLATLPWTESQQGPIRVSHPVAWHLEAGARPGHLVLLNVLAPDRVDIERVGGAPEEAAQWQQRTLAAWRERRKAAKRGEQLGVRPLAPAALPPGFRGVRLDVKRAQERFVVVEAYGGKAEAPGAARWHVRLQTAAERLPSAIRVLSKMLRRLRGGAAPAAARSR